MFRTFLGAFLLTGLLATAAVPANALPGEPLADVAIAIEGTADGNVYSAKGVTGPDGFVRFYNIPAGSYRVTTTHTARALERALRLAAARAAKLAVPASDHPAPPPPPPERTAVSGLAMPVRPPSLTVLMTASGTTRTARHAISALSDGMEMLQFTIVVSSPVAVSLRHEED